ncbi:hypothetical protein BU16DRAFT_84315 [Lophium mytilinum]|uniref:Uncharacterized protein n=1 Tax=Lophium mytilinum TaxID=390894 RepID=A0A6A6QM69_9PEZI|nr:hypothetical protein BU16DRAFT_84315 [Lophium mytilinum]
MPSLARSRFRAERAGCFVLVIFHRGPWRGFKRPETVTSLARPLLLARELKAGEGRPLISVHSMLLLPSPSLSRLLASSVSVKGAS